MIASAWHEERFDCAINDSWSLVRGVGGGRRRNRTSMFAHKTRIPCIPLCVSRRCWRRIDVLWNCLSASFEGWWAMRLPGRRSTRRVRTATATPAVHRVTPQFSKRRIKRQLRPCPQHILRQHLPISVRRVAGQREYWAACTKLSKSWYWLDRQFFQQLTAQRACSATSQGRPAQLEVITPTANRLGKQFHYQSS